jgi:hypothetical protein
MTSLLDQLGAAGPAADLEPDLYRRLIGVWDVTNHYRTDDGWVDGTVVWTFGRVLDGRAVQDVMWFTAPGPDGFPVRETGSTMRLFDPAAGAWHVVWFSPAGRVTALVGRAGERGDIVQEGVRPDGRAIRWVFTELTDDTFRWLGHVSDDGGRSWLLEQEMRARRRGPASRAG